MFKEGEENPLMDEVISLLPEITKAGSSVTLDSVEWVEWAFSAVRANPEYYTYHGSLTTEPFTENVNWIVLITPITLSGCQVRDFVNHIDSLFES